MRIRKRSFFEILLPLIFLFFLGRNTSFIDPLHPTLLEWPLLFALFGYLFLNKKLLNYINRGWLVLLMVYIVWFLSTNFWSEVPLLSVIKSTLFAVVIITMISAGSLWVVRFGHEKAINFLFLILLVAVISNLIGLNSGSFHQSGMKISAGLSSNPNNFGFLLAIVSSIILWNLYQTWGNRWYSLLWGLLLLIDIHGLLRSYSRSATAIFLCIIYFFLISLSGYKKMMIIVSVLFAMLMIVLLNPMVIVTLEQGIVTHVLKRADESSINTQQMLYTRNKVWQKSYQQAVKGGWLGGGFYVTIGENDFSLSHPNAYGREKGNSQLAIMEETGIIGLSLCFLLVISFYWHALKYYRHLKPVRKKVAMGLVLGMISGLLAESFVEAWWDSLGPEVFCFWAFIGVIFGMIYLWRVDISPKM
ncbi:MAG: hypothetical protein A3C44_03445 [Gammaproteobacteria bacterium RIFCSPHIGHO2_02_FULL_39_13]|nr:MAG: hypothetical protein A3C44_03445 [Gammaproteobacteria bacterium RIFCSPHIGHO2_02_FULL_39_13]OGT48584.1 MAG: hypothetical protein A3E53_04335 [Gammaproteobacteria bacterium RIFCSPHIGHO2_12_FULL_39_24]